MFVLSYERIEGTRMSHEPISSTFLKKKIFNGTKHFGCLYIKNIKSATKCITKKSLVLMVSTANSMCEVLKHFSRMQIHTCAGVFISTSNWGPKHSRLEIFHV